MVEKDGESTQRIWACGISEAATLPKSIQLFARKYARQWFATAASDLRFSWKRNAVSEGYSNIFIGKVLRVPCVEFVWGWNSKGKHSFVGSPYFDTQMVRNLQATNPFHLSLKGNQKETSRCCGPLQRQTHFIPQRSHNKSGLVLKWPTH